MPGIISLVASGDSYSADNSTLDNRHIRIGKRTMSTSISSAFKIDKPFAERKAESAEIREKYPHHIPVICEQAPRTTRLPELAKRKFLVPESITVSQLYCILRTRLGIDSTTSIYLNCNGVFLSGTSCLGRIDSECRDIDGFLYISYTGQETFG